MSRVLASPRTRLIVAAVAALAVALSLLAFIPSASGTDENNMLAYELTGWACFAAGDTVSIYNVKNIYEIDTETAGFATLQGRAGKGVAVQYVRLNTVRDAIAVYLTKPAVRPVCAAFHLQQLNTFG